MQKFKIPFFVSIPHSGTKIPQEADWLKNLTPSLLMCDIDTFVDDLYFPVLEEFKIPFVLFSWHRYAVDVNRFATDISSLTVEMSEENKPNFFSKKHLSDVHWHKTTKGDVLIKNKLSQKLHRELINKYFHPFHKELQEKIQELQRTDHKQVFHLDLHSMPSQGLNYHKDAGERRSQIVIGDNEGRSSSKDFRDLVSTAYCDAGFEVVFNKPYKGGAITQQYGQPHLGQHSLQIELNRGLYIDEQIKEKNCNYTRTQNQLKQAITYIVKNLHLIF